MEKDNFQIEFSVKNIIHYLFPHSISPSKKKYKKTQNPRVLIQGEKQYNSQLQLLDLEAFMEVLTW